MERIRLSLAYDGTHFHGWAAQPGLRTVEGELHEVIALLTGAPRSITVAGRTDAGVHARGQVAHFDVEPEVLERVRGRYSGDALEALQHRMMALLSRRSEGPKGSSDLIIREAKRAPEGFDARFSALSRSYTYRISDDPRAWDPLRRNDVLWVREVLDVEAMNRAAVPLLGEHDFLSYCKPREGATTIRELLELRAERRDGLIEVKARADAFCHSMVRTLVGTLMRVGVGQRPESWPQERLEARSRDTGEVIVAPPHPLTLESVEYPEDHLLAARAIQTRAVRDCGCGD